MTAQSTVVPVNAQATQTISSSPGVTLRGFWLVTSGAATVTIYDNTSASGTVLAQWTTAAANADKEFDFTDGVRCAIGIFVSASAGTVTGNVRIG